MAEARAARSGWPPMARRALTVLLLVHMVAVLSAEMVVEPSSVAQKWLFRQCLPYTSLLDLDHAHRYYAPPPSSTPLVRARLRFADGRPVRVISLPDKAAWPRLRYQRGLALAYHLSADVEGDATDESGPLPPKVWASSYAHHLCDENPGCSGVTLSVVQHRLPPPERVREAVAGPGGPVLDLEAEEFFSIPEVVGELSCVEP